MRAKPCIFFILTLSILFSSSSSFCQYPFGKNKIQYFSKDWRVIETEHAEIFYYPDESAIAKYVSGFVEDVYDEYSSFFKLEFDRKIPIILYGTHHDFKETNVIPYMVSEGTGGFTEFIKGRVALPFMGSYPELKSVFRHEMVHVFMLEKLRVVMDRRRMFNYAHPPLWFTEGLAEFLAHGGQDSDAEMFIRDAVTFGRLYSLDDLWRILGTYMMYKEGESALHYIATRFGDDAIRVILENWWKSDKFDVVLERSIGIKTRDLDEDWQEYLRRKYFPAVLNRRRITEIAEQISPDEWSFENHPVVVHGKDGKDRYFCLGYGMGSIDIFELVKNEKGKWKRNAVLRGERSDRFESIPLLRSRLSSRGDTLFFVSKAGERDAIYFLDTSAGKVTGSVRFESARIINSPAMSCDRTKLAFTAIDAGGRTDLFLYDMATGEFSRLTEDYYQECHPDWSADNKSVVFSSEKRDAEPGDNRAIYSIDIQSGRIMSLTSGDCKDDEPRFLPDGSGLLFSSDRNGAFDIYLLKDGTIARQTGVLGGAFDPCPTGDAEEFLTASYSGGTYHIYKAGIVDSGRMTDASISEVPDVSWEPAQPDTAGGSYTEKDYQVRFGIDLIAAAFAVDPDYGYMGNGAQMFLTDIMGDHQLVLLFGSASDDFSDFWDNLNVGFTYINRTRRVNYAFGAFHLAGYIGSINDLLRYEKRYGVMGGISYPFSKFRRVDFQTIFKYMERDDDITYIGIQEGRSTLISNYLSMTDDNIVWNVGGPLNGHRVNAALGRSFDVNGSRYESTTLHIDLRNYINFGSRVVFAQRFVNRNAWGSDIQLFYLGGAWDLRGYDFRRFAGKRIYLLNNEIRFPLVDGLIVRLPFGDIEFPLFRGSIFLDAGKVEGFIMDTDWLGSIGTGVEMNLGYLPVIRVNFVRRTDFKTIDSDTRVDVFLGFNF